MWNEDLTYSGITDQDITHKVLRCGLCCLLSLLPRIPAQRLPRGRSLPPPLVDLPPIKALPHALEQSLVPHSPSLAAGKMFPWHSCPPKNLLLLLLQEKIAHSLQTGQGQDS